MEHISRTLGTVLQKINKQNAQRVSVDPSTSWVDAHERWVDFHRFGVGDWDKLRAMSQALQFQARALRWMRRQG